MFRDKVSNINLTEMDDQIPDIIEGFHTHGFGIQQV